ncbi:hypothetical protein [Micromonospora sp. CB01531]|uniref:hypothetical protein n=1 Tax=Micromonospora sp. CB01531 TaxID=1718947 RepID=UPI000938B36D|nr:hypothetical protein [Micromonospora sp. CB01531]OKI45102.1 hypothetical protein A6A27_11830 [Micromonospora sp. CB01531]
MPVEQRTDPTLVSAGGFAMKAVSNGVLQATIRIDGDPAMGFPPDDELTAILLELFAAVGAVGWSGSVTKNYSSSHTIFADAVAPPAPDEPPAEPAPE